MISFLVALLSPLLSLLAVPIFLFAIAMMMLRRLPRVGGGALGAVGKLVTRAVIGTVRGIGHIYQLVATPKASTTFSVTDKDGRRRQVRILRDVPELRLHDEVRVRGARVGGVLNAAVILIPETGVKLRPSTTVINLITVILTVLAVATLIGAWR